jgi:hypothetical protein
VRNSHVPSAVTAPLSKSYCCKITSIEEVRNWESAMAAVAATNYLSLTMGRNVEDGQTRAARSASSICPEAFEPSSLFRPLVFPSHNLRLFS